MGSGGRHGEAENELGAFHGLALHVNAASVGLDDSLDQTEAEAGALDLAGESAPAAEKRLEDACLLVLGDARTAVGHADLHHLALTPGVSGGGYADPRLLAGAVLGGVADQVFEHLLEGQRIA